MEKFPAGAIPRSLLQGSFNLQRVCVNLAKRLL